MKEDRGTEKRWYQKPEFLWTIITFILLQGATAWRSSNDAAAKGAVQARSFDELKRSFDDFQKVALGRLDGIDKRQEEYQAEQRRAWQAEHDSNSDLKGKYELLKTGLDGLQVEVHGKLKEVDAANGDNRELRGKLADLEKGIDILRRDVAENYKIMMTYQTKPPK